MLSCESKAIAALIEAQGKAAEVAGRHSHFAKNGILGKDADLEMCQDQLELLITCQPHIGQFDSKPFALVLIMALCTVLLHCVLLLFVSFTSCLSMR